MEERIARRKPNWTDTEQFIMLDAYSKFKDVLACPTTSNQEKTKCWTEITKELNKFNPAVRRAMDEVKRKWHNLLGQGRRDFYDWKQTCQNPNPHPGPVSMPAISCRVLELNGGFNLEEWKERFEPGPAKKASHQEEEFIYVEAGSSDIISEGQGTVECPDSPGIAEPEVNTLAPDCVKQECPSPKVHVINDPSAVYAYKSSAVLSATPTISTAFHTGTTTNLGISTPPNEAQLSNPPSLTFHAADSNHTNELQTRNCNASPFPNHTLQISSPRHITPPTIVSMATINNISSSRDQTTLSELPSLLGPITNPQPSEPPRKKVRLSESGVPERGAGLHSEREAELRLDILQLEKDKLWLETEKLRLEIDILRKQKQQMNANY